MFAFYLSYPFLFVFARLPFWMLYAISDIAYIVLYKWIGYRKKVVFQNLQNSFPNKTPSEIEAIAEKYYRFLCDLTLETFRKMTVSEAEIRKRCVYLTAPEEKKAAAEGRSMVLLMGHFGNWEWGGIPYMLDVGPQLYVVYKTLSNPWFEKWTLKLRTRFGIRLVKMENTLREVIARKGQQSTFTFIADQTPVPPAPLWLSFLHQDTPVFTGGEKIAMKMNYPVFFVSVRRIARGRYEVYSELISENPKTEEPHAITKRYFKMLEREIEANPEIWLWSHRRWKHKRPVD